MTPVITIYLPDTDDKVTSGPAPIGKRRIEITALLEVIMFDQNPKPEDGELIFDNILDSIDTQLHLNYNLGGVVGGSAIKGIQTHLGVPQMVEGQTVFRVAIKKFDITLNITGA